MPAVGAGVAEVIEPVGEAGGALHANEGEVGHVEDDAIEGFLRGFEGVAEPGGERARLLPDGCLCFTFTSI